jgi:hypothetical protein
MCRSFATVTMTTPLSGDRSEFTIDLPSKINVSGRDRGET